MTIYLDADLAEPWRHNASLRYAFHSLRLFTERDENAYNNIDKISKPSRTVRYDDRAIFRVLSLDA